MNNLENKDCYYIGIDPGWKNLGFAIVREDTTGKLTKEYSKVFNPSAYSSSFSFIQLLEDRMEDFSADWTNIKNVTIERYVSYAGINSSETENITMLIGALNYYFSSCEFSREPLLLRAIDWKIPLVKELVKQKGFNNPSSKLDKKFSIAAAKASLDEPTEFETDHEADAVCLAVFSLYTGKISQYELNK